jgi:glycosyltransferase involved in cell wall biosynthesis
MNRPRIMIIENSIAITGALKSVVESSLQLAGKFDFIFLLPSGSTGIDFVRRHGFVCHEMRMPEIRRDFFSLAAYLPFLLINTVRISRLIASLAIDLVNVNDFYNLLPAVYKFFGGKKPYVCYVRFLPSKFPTGLVRFWFGFHQRYADVVIAVSEAVRKELPDGNKVRVIPNQLPGPAAAYVPALSSVILYPANYIRGKGQRYALESFSGICEKYPEWKLRFVGGDMGLKKNKAYKQSLLLAAKTLGISERVEWGGFSDAMEAEYGKAAIVLNFSESESFSLTCLESLYYGRPVIATRCGGPEEIITPDSTGLLVPVGNVPEMTKALEFLVSDPEVRDKLARNAYFSVREKFSYQKTIGLLEEVYLESLKGI